MTVTSVNSTTFLSDTQTFLRDHLNTNITDPISTVRHSTSKFVLTSYPARESQYPLITVVVPDINTPTRLGMQSVLHQLALPVQIRVWARNVTERDQLSQQVINQLRTADLTTIVPATLFDFQLTSAPNVDEPGQAGIKSRVLNFQYSFILGG